MKVKEIFKVAAVCALSIGVMSSAFIGFNRLTFSAATNGTEPLPIVEALSPAPAPLAQTEQNEQDDYAAFVPPTAVTIVASPWLNDHPNNTVSEHAMQMEEAARIGAEYIWDIFGERIDGMYVEMFYASWPGQMRSYWIGNVGSIPASAVGRDETLRSYSPQFSFTIDAVTGMRVDIGRLIDRLAGLSEEELEAFMQWRTGDERRDWHIAWHYKNTAERMAYLGLTDADIEPYLQTAREAAARHFNTTTLVLETESFAITAGPANIPSQSAFSGILFTIEDNTGRELQMSLHNGEAVSIHTQHNDIVPGFSYYAPGSIG
ncbi:MAG: hypothetical protein FWB96_10410 [Defluviitaleaceae bacterium]|nr:hypothetical protein [Defluviitaleaceae bacterium]MCL2263655.1 hypothetical protein [Defluviitaleaceae bacterium]MCL2263888.1 hypothetical protein [Defluviitaleaceae bacterium]MCL2264146.1 hypothetical protein [Defluviitaleaceae bacterium]